MVKRQRRMTVKKKKSSGGSKLKTSKKPTKGKKVIRGAKPARSPSKTSRANQATKVLMKALKKQTGDNE